MPSTDQTAQFGESAPEREPSAGEGTPEFLAGWTRYEIAGRLGAGGMGEVFKAWDPQLGRYVALKFLYGTDPETLDRFTREARSQARVDHPGICKVYEVGTVSGHPYIAMQEIEGVTLDQAARTLTLEQKVRLVRDVAEAMHAAHRLGLIHRDLKPNNILVETLDDGSMRPYVVDFGLARDQASPSASTLAGNIAGTAGYMSPEQARGRPEQIDRRTDVYNLGVILFELLTGRTPFDTQNIFDALLRVQNEDAPSPRKFQPSTPQDLDTIILKCLERDAARRYDSARAVADDLERFLDGEPILARRASVFYRLRKRVAKHRTLAAVIVVATLLLAATGGAALRSRWQSDRRAELAHRFGEEVKEMELVTRIANMLPPERAVAPRRLLAPRMQRMWREMNALGTLARGPGYYALARAHLALGDIEQGRRMIDLAWASGNDSAEARYTRGEILGRLYQAALVKASHINDKQLRENAVRAAKDTWRTPALRDLRHSGGATIDSPAFLEAEIAFFEERWDDALAAARRASTETPWLYEARMLEATILRTRSTLELFHGDMEGARVLLDGAGVAMEAVLNIARSDAVAHTEECTRRAARLRLSEFQRPLTDADVREAAAPCHQATAIDPAHAAAWLTLARVHNTTAEAQSRLGVDPAANANAAIAAADRAVALQPDSGDAHYNRGVSALNRGRYAFSRGEDPRPVLEDAVRALRRAVALEPRNANVRNALANAYTIRAYHEARIGADQSRSLREAVANYEVALEIYPDFVLAMSNLGSALVQLGGRPQLDRAVAVLTKAAQQMPGNASFHNNRGNAFLTLAETTLAAGGDPAAEAREGIVSLRKAIELRPDYALPRYNIAESLRLVALHRMQHGSDPSPQLAAAREAIARYDALSPGDPDASLLHARLALVAARHALNSGRNPRAYRAEAERHARNGLAIEPDSEGLRVALAEAQSLAPRR